MKRLLGPTTTRAFTFIVVAVALACSSCTGGNTQPPAITVSVGPMSASVQAGATAQFSATVTNDPANRGVTWTVTCSAAPCGSVSPASTASGVATTYTAPASPPASGVMVTVSATSVTDPAKASSATVTVASPLMISTVSSPDGTVGAMYSQKIQAAGGESPFTWGVLMLKGGGLPAGLTLATSSGNSVTISGTPTTVQTNVGFTIQVGDASGQFAAQNYVVSIKGTTAQTTNGPVQGTLVACGLPECAASNVLEFLGIPYAAPPMGSLRWRPPQPTVPSQPQQPGARCVSANAKGVVRGQEDCLYLNVFVASQTPHGQPQPVMVYIHGGANRMESGNPGVDYSDPPELSTQGVILVTVEYRLGILGFFANSSLDAESASKSSGNYGLRDQIAALAWVQQNIASFGGDPTHIAVFGTSSGSSDIEALLTSPLTQGPLSQCGASQPCFSAAIMEGGSVVHDQYLSLANKEAQDAPLVAGLTGCGATDISCLRGVPTATLVAPCVPPATTGCNPNGAYSTWYTQIDPALVVNLEPDVVPVNPYDRLQQLGGSPVPLLLGSNREDASMQGMPSWCAGVTLPATQCPNDDPASSQMDEAGFDNAIHAEFDSPVTPSGSNSILSLYPPSSTLNLPVWQLIAVDSDLTVGATCPYREAARAAVGSNGAPVWRYVYTHTFENNDPNLTPYRAFHGAQKYFVFGDPSFADPGTYTPTPAELALSGQIMGYWTRFAATGNPNGAQAPVWPPYNATTDPVLQIDDDSHGAGGTVKRLIQINGYRTQQCDFYDANATAFVNLQ